MSVTSDNIRLELQHPKCDFQARIRNIVRNDYSAPFLLSLELIFEAPSLKEAPDIADERLAECLNMIALVTGAGIRRHRIKQIVDCTPVSGMRECLVWVDSAGHEDPQPFLDQNIMGSMERLLQSDLPSAVRRAMRWYRIGLHESIADDQFQYFWFALEILAEHQKSTEKVADKCPQCKSPLYCENCKTHPTHRPYAKQAIRDLIQAADKTCKEETIEALDKTRNALMHGRTLAEIEADRFNTGQHIVDVLGEIVFKALVNQFPKETFKETITFGRPNTYVHWTRTGFVHISTIVPQGEDGELDLSFKGLTVTTVTDDPPQSGRPSIIPMTPAQHNQLELLSRKQGDHQELCKRVCKRVKVQDEKRVTLILATDMARIQGALKRAETGDWQDLFREILSANASGGMPKEGK
ncbi:methylamine utilization protein MauJ [Nitrospira sp. NS4]|uniref:methylamine utilization protein MauJ n=1 Tax=Nitrospira sp. NS4 TaxID=3414498 RepID=UPI003C2B587B